MIVTSILHAIVLNDGNFNGEYGDRVTVGKQIENSCMHVNMKDEVAPFDFISDESPTSLSGIQEIR